MQQEFIWRGFSQTGHKKRGSIKATNLKEARQKLTTKKILISKIKLRHTFFSNKKINKKELNLFPSELHTLLKAGIPLLNALYLLEKNCLGPNYAELLNTISEDLKKGSMLSEALKKHPRYFDNLFLNLINVGEISGTLETMLFNISTNKTKLAKQKRQLKKALFYPTTVLSVAFIVSTIMLLFVLPRFQELWQSFGAPLPLYTKLMLNFAYFIKHFAPYLLLALTFIAAILTKLYQKKIGVKFLLHKKLATKIPFVKTVVNFFLTARVMRVLAITFASGLPILDCLSLTASVSNNLFYQKELFSVKDKISKGNMLSESFKQSGILDRKVIAIIKVGEASGNLDTILFNIADNYDEELNNLVSNMQTLLEPLLMIVLGIIVGGILIAIYLPIFRMGQVIH